MKRLALLASCCLAIASCGSPPRVELPKHPPAFFDDVLRTEASRYSLMQPEDLYKLVHQSILGPSHLFFGLESRLDTGLNVEIAQIKPAPAQEPSEPEVEMLDPQLNLARVNLRPYLQHGGKADNLLRAIARTAQEHRGDRAEFLGALARAEEMVPELNLGLVEPSPKGAKAKEVKIANKEARDETFDDPTQAIDRTPYQQAFHDYVEEMRKKGFPSGEHSQTYADVYAPAYRIVYLQYVTDRDYGGRVPPRVDEHNGMNPDPWTKGSKGTEAAQGNPATAPASSPAPDEGFLPPSNGDDHSPR